DKEGVWRIEARFLEQSTYAVLDEKTFTMTATAVEYTGLIVFCDMYKSPEGQIPFPATVVANNEYFKVFIDCKNTSTVAYIAGVELKVYDPDGILRASPTIDWANIPSNKELEWEYKNFCRVDKEGTWTINVRFLEQSTSTVLDEKTFTMTAMAVEYAGTVTKKQLTYDETIGIIPVTADVPIFSRGIVTVLGRNDADAVINQYFEIIQACLLDFLSEFAGAPSHHKFPDYIWIDPGKNYSFTASFTMPNKDIRLHAWSYYWTGA
ncbi:unnamed protein product, partial [marine sediment metagenome]